MRRPIVIVVRSSTIRVTIVGRRGAIELDATSALGVDQAVGDVLSSMLTTATSRVRGRRAIAIVGPARSQLRRLSGLPSIDDASMLARIVTQNPRRFFLGASAVLATTDVHGGGDGGHWCAAFDRALIDELVAGGRAARVTIAAVLPIAALAGQHTGDGEVRYADPPESVTVRVVGRRLVHVVRGRAAASDCDNEDAQKKFELHAIRRATIRTPIAWRSAPSGLLATQGRRVAALAACALLLATSVPLATTAGAVRAGDVAARRLAALGDTPHRITEATSALQQVTIAIDQIERFASARRPATNLLRDIAQALPESTAITSLRVDSLGVTLTILAPHVADAVPALAGVSGALSPRLTGSATRETDNGAQLERATLRFRFAGTQARRQATVPGIRRQR
jgi:Tfp pilus assembly protein PilN